MVVITVAVSSVCCLNCSVFLGEAQVLVLLVVFFVALVVIQLSSPVSFVAVAIRFSFSLVFFASAEARFLSVAILFVVVVFVAAAVVAIAGVLRAEKI